MPALRSGSATLPASTVSRNACSLLNLAPENKESIIAVIGIIDLLPIEFCEQNDRQREVNLFRSIDKDVAYTDYQSAVMQSGGMVQACEWKKFHFDVGQRSSRAQLAVGGFEDGFQVLHANWG